MKRASLTRRVAWCALLALGCNSASDSASTSARDASADEHDASGAPRLDADARVPELDVGFDVDEIVRALAAAGFTVQEGRFAFFDLDTCRELPSCFGNNPSSPYGLYFVPPAPGQITREQGLQADGTSPGFRLRHDEALLWLGKTPPEAAYYSFRSYAFDRAGATPSAERTPLFASLGESLNHEVIGTADGARFDRPAAVITTAHRGVEASVRAALFASDVPERAVNLDVIPASLVRMGLAEDADTFTMLFRVALFASDSARAAYQAHPPARVFRLTPARQRAPDPFDVPALRPKKTAPDETSLAASLDALEQAVRELESIPLAVSVPVTYRALDGFECLLDSSNCLGDNRDTTYAAALVGRITSQQTLYVLGVNHAATGKATYANVSVYALDKLLGVAAVDDRTYAGTARRYLPDDPNVDELFVWKLARDCGDDTTCTEVPEDFPGLDENALAAVAFRAYLEPGQATAPSPDTLLLERVLKSGGR